MPTSPGPSTVDAVKILLVTVVVGLVLVGGAQAAGSDRYAGISRDAAVAKAKSTVIGFEMAFNGTSVAKAVEYRHQLDTHPPKVTKSQCQGRKAWRVLWPDSDPIFVRKGGGSFGCGAGAFTFH